MELIQNTQQVFPWLMIVNNKLLPRGARIDSIQHTWTVVPTLIVLNLLLGDSLFWIECKLASSAVWGELELVSMTTSVGMCVGVGERIGVVGVWMGVGEWIGAVVGAGETILCFLGWGTCWGTLFSALFVGDRSLCGAATGWGGLLPATEPFWLSEFSSGPGRDSFRPKRVASANREGVSAWKIRMVPFLPYLEFLQEISPHHLISLN